MIKKLTALSIVFFFLAGFGNTEEKRDAGFERLKSLNGDWVGEWSGKAEKDVKATFRLISGDTSLMQTMSDFHGEMVTTYYADGNHLMLTHYCNANNQPRLRSEASVAQDVITFSFHDATNMASPEEGHIEKLVMTVPDPNHIRQDWTWREGGATRTDTISFKRIR